MYALQEPVHAVQLHRTRLCTALPLFAPYLVKQGVQWYETAKPPRAAEARLGSAQVSAIIVASAFVSALDVSVDQGFDIRLAADVLKRSLQSGRHIVGRDAKAESLKRVEVILNGDTTVADEPMEERLSRAWWSAYQKLPFFFPSAMSAVVEHGLTIRQLMGGSRLVL